MWLNGALVQQAIDHKILHRPLATLTARVSSYTNKQGRGPNLSDEKHEAQMKE